MTMMNVDYFAKRVAVEKHMMENNGITPVMIDPATITLITTLSVQLIKCLVKRYGNNTESIEKKIKKPSWMDTIRLKRVVRKVLGWRRYRKEGGNVIEALRRTGGKLTVNDIYALITDGV